VTYLAIHAFTLATNFPREVAEETILEKYEEGKFHPPTLMTTFGVEHGRTDEWVGSARHKGGSRRGTFGEYAEKRRGQRARHVCGMCEACTMQHARGRNPMYEHPGAKKNIDCCPYGFPIHHGTEQRIITLGPIPAIV
jgi:hypothetical protein